MTALTPRLTSPIFDPANRMCGSCRHYRDPVAWSANCQLRIDARNALPWREQGPVADLIRRAGNTCERWEAREIASAERAAAKDRREAA